MMFYRLALTFVCMTLIIALSEGKTVRVGSQRFVDKLLIQDHVESNSEEEIERTYTVDEPNVMHYVVLHDNAANDDGGNAEVVSGGPQGSHGSHSITVRFSDNNGSGIDFDVRIWGSERNQDEQSNSSES